MPIFYDKTSLKANGGSELMMRGLEARIPQDILNKFSIGRALMLFDQKLPRIYWTHNLPGQLKEIPEVNEEYVLVNRNRWKYHDFIVFVSEWQKQEYIKYYGMRPTEHKRLKVILNSIVPITEHIKPNNSTLRIIYTSVPNKGLDILYPVFKQLCLKYDIELEVYSSFKLYGMQDVDYHNHTQLLAKIKLDPKVIYHAYGTNEEVKQSLQRAHIYALPSTYQETSCIALIEAMSAKCLCVHPEYAALPETANNYTNMYKYSSNVEEHRSNFSVALENTIVQYLKKDVQHLDQQKEYVDEKYSWNNAVDMWMSLFYSIPQAKLV